jgi:hypothetical protein
MLALLGIFNLFLVSQTVSVHPLVIIQTLMVRRLNYNAHLAISNLQ